MFLWLVLLFQGNPGVEEQEPLLQEVTPPLESSSLACGCLGKPQKLEVLLGGGRFLCVFIGSVPFSLPSLELPVKPLALKKLYIWPGVWLRVEPQILVLGDFGDDVFGRICPDLGPNCGRLLACACLTALSSTGLLCVQYNGLLWSSPRSTWTSARGAGDAAERPEEPREGGLR